MWTKKERFEAVLNHELADRLPRSLMMSRSRWMMLLSVLISEVEGLCHSSIRAWRISEERA